MTTVSKVIWNRRLTKKIKKLPDFIQASFYAWVSSVELSGLEKTRQRPGYHDEPLKGVRQGQRSVRLNRSYRSIYIEHKNGHLEFLEVIEVNKHEY